MEAVTRPAVHVVEKQIESQNCWSFKMVVMVTGIAVAALGLLVAAFAQVAYLAAAFTLTEISLIIGTVTVREHQRMRSLPKIARDLREENTKLSATNLSLEEQVTSLKSEVDELTITAEKMDSLYHKYKALEAECQAKQGELSNLVEENRAQVIRIEEATRQLEDIRRKIDAEVERFAQENAKYKALNDRLAQLST